ncbi:MAG: CoA transferase [Alcaligenaceae bacterium]|nr:CoA transferase [Alcaligenaceae bacterium]
MTTAHPPSSGPLAGIRIVDLTSVIFGPYASQILADYGADVIKLESPQGDSTRNTGPRYEDGLAALFLSVNRNKRGIVLNLKQEAARQALLQLLDTADVFMHSIRPQKMAALGLSPEELRARNPKLIYAGLLGFGSGGAYEGKPAYDDTIQGLSGIADIMARQTGEPRYFPAITADKTCGLIAAHAILAALFQRERSGLGQTVEIPMFESMVSFNMVEHLYGRHFVDDAGPTGYPRLMSRWRKPYRTADGYLCMMPYTDTHWRNFFTHSGHPEFADDPRFADIAARTRHIDALYSLAQEIAARHTTEYWVELLTRIEVPATRINSLDDLESDPHLADVGLFVEIEDEAARRYRFIRNPVRLQHGDIAPGMPPRLGEHTRAVLKEAGLSSEQIEALFTCGAAH